MSKATTPAEDKAAEAAEKARIAEARAAARPQEQNPKTLVAIDRGYYDGVLYEPGDVFENTLNLPVMRPAKEAVPATLYTQAEPAQPAKPTWFKSADKKKAASEE
jgi:hypothetical protein